MNYDEAAKDALLKIDTHIRRFGILMKKLLDDQKALVDEVYKLSPYMTPEYIASINDIFGRIRDDAEGISEVTKLVGDDFHEFGEANIAEVEEIRKMLNHD